MSTLSYCSVCFANCDHTMKSCVCFLLEIQALESLNKKDITEIKSYGKPPVLVEKVLEAVMILRGNEATWAEAKRQLGEWLSMQVIHLYEPI